MKNILGLTGFVLVLAGFGGWEHSAESSPNLVQIVVMLSGLAVCYFAFRGRSDVS